MCIPNQLCQSNISVNEKSKILLRALGALRTLRSHRRIVADEAAYRALIVACGKCGTDRRIELMKLYGLMRTDGIFPNAVTLGQYTRAIAEGFSRRSEESHAKSGMQIVVPTNGKKPSQKVNLEVLDSNLQSLEGTRKLFFDCLKLTKAHGLLLCIRRIGPTLEITWQLFTNSRRSIIGCHLFRCCKRSDGGEAYYYLSH